MIKLVVDMLQKGDDWMLDEPEDDFRTLRSLLGLLDAIDCPQLVHLVRTNPAQNFWLDSPMHLLKLGSDRNDLGIGLLGLHLSTSQQILKAGLDTGWAVRDMLSSLRADWAKVLVGLLIDAETGDVHGLDGVMPDGWTDIPGDFEEGLEAMVDGGE